MATELQTGSGALILAGANTFTGGTTINASAGVVQLNNTNALQDSVVTLNALGALLTFQSGSAAWRRRWIVRQHQPNDDRFELESKPGRPDFGQQQLRRQHHRHLQRQSHQ